MAILIQTGATANPELFYVDKGLFSGHGIAAPSGTTANVTPAFGGEVAGGNPTTPGVCTAPPDNTVLLLDQKKVELVHAATSNRVFGRLTFGGGVWTLTYVYFDATGTEQVIGNIATDTTEGGLLTDIQMAGVPKSYAALDPARPFGEHPATLEIAWGLSGLAAQGDKLNTIAGLNLKTTFTGGGAPILYTVPAAKSLIIKRAIVRVQVGTGITGDATCGIGVAGGETDTFAQQRLINMRTPANSYEFLADAQMPVWPAGSVLRFGCSVAAVGGGGSVLTAAVDLTGYLV